MVIGRVILGTLLLHCVHARLLRSGEFIPTSLELPENFTCTNCIGYPFFITPPGIEDKITVSFDANNGHRDDDEFEYGTAFYDDRGEVPQIRTTYTTPVANVSVTGYSSANNAARASRTKAYFAFIALGAPLNVDGVTTLDVNTAYNVKEPVTVSISVIGKGNVFVLNHALNSTLPPKNQPKVLGRVFEGEFTMWPGDLVVVIEVGTTGDTRIQATTTHLPELSPSPHPISILTRNRVFALPSHGAVRISPVEGSPVLQLYLLNTRGQRVGHHFVDQKEDFTPFTLSRGPSTYVQFVLEGDELYGNGRTALRVDAALGNTTEVTWNGTLKSCVECSLHRPFIAAPWAASISIHNGRNGTSCIYPRRNAPHKLFGSANCSMLNIGKVTVTTGHSSVPVSLTWPGEALFYTNSVGEDSVLDSRTFRMAYGDIVLPKFRKFPVNVRITVGNGTKAGIGVQTPDGVRFLTSGGVVRFVANLKKEKTTIAFWNAFSSSPVDVVVEQFEVHLKAGSIITDELFKAHYKLARQRLFITPVGSEPSPATAIREFDVDPLFGGEKLEGIPYTGHTTSVELKPRKSITFDHLHSLVYGDDWNDMRFVSKEGFPGFKLKKYNVTLGNVCDDCEEGWMCTLNGTCANVPPRVRVPLQYGKPVKLVVDASESHNKYEYVLNIPSSGLFSLTVQSHPRGPALLITESVYGDTIVRTPQLYLSNGEAGPVVRGGNNTIWMCGSENMTMVFQVFPMNFGNITFEVNRVTNGPRVLTGFPSSLGPLISTQNKSYSEVMYCRLTASIGRNELLSVQRVGQVKKWDSNPVATGPCTFVIMGNDYYSDGLVDRRSEATAPCSMYKSVSWFIPELWSLNYLDTIMDSLVLMYTAKEFNTLMNIDFNVARWRKDVYTVTLSVDFLPKWKEPTKITVIRGDANTESPPISSILTRIQPTLLSDVALKSDTIQWKDNRTDDYAGKLFSFTFRYYICFSIPGFIDQCNITDSPNNFAYFLPTMTNTMYPYTPPIPPTPPYNWDAPTPIYSPKSSSHWYYYGAGGGGAVGVIAAILRYARICCGVTSYATRKENKKVNKEPLVTSQTAVTTLNGDL